jgi:large subunit ribosomal protein L10
LPSVFKGKKGGVAQLKLEKKKNIVADLKERFSKSKVVIVTNYMGLNVTSINSLRRQLREADCEYQVVKNTLLRRASERTDVALIKETFVGPNAVAFSYENPVTPAKVLTEFAKSNDKLEIKAGVMDGRVLDGKAVSALSALPSREVLLAKLLSAMNGVPVSFVRALNNIPQRMLNVLQAIKDQKATA